jgi:hypothetical protein
LTASGGLAIGVCTKKQDSRNRATALIMAQQHKPHAGGSAAVCCIAVCALLLVFDPAAGATVVANCRQSRPACLNKATQAALLAGSETAADGTARHQQQCSWQTCTPACSMLDMQLLWFQLSLWRG